MAGRFGPNRSAKVCSHIAFGALPEILARRLPSNTGMVLLALRPSGRDEKPTDDGGSTRASHPGRLQNRHTRIEVPREQDGISLCGPPMRRSFCSAPALGNARPRDARSASRCDFYLCGPAPFLKQLSGGFHLLEAAARFHGIYATPACRSLRKRAMYPFSGRAVPGFGTPARSAGTPARGNVLIRCARRSSDVDCNYQKLNSLGSVQLISRPFSAIFSMWRFSPWT